MYEYAITLKYNQLFRWLTLICEGFKVGWCLCSSYTFIIIYYDECIIAKMQPSLGSFMKLGVKKKKRKKKKAPPSPYFSDACGTKLRADTQEVLRLFPPTSLPPSSLSLPSCFPHVSAVSLQVSEEL